MVMIGMEQTSHNIPIIRLSTKVEKEIRKGLLVLKNSFTMNTPSLFEIKLKI